MSVVISSTGYAQELTLSVSWYPLDSSGNPVVGSLATITVSGAPANAFIRLYKNGKFLYGKRANNYGNASLYDVPNEIGTVTYQVFCYHAGVLISSNKLSFTVDDVPIQAGGAGLSHIPYYSILLLKYPPPLLINPATNTPVAKMYYPNNQFTTSNYAATGSIPTGNLIFVQNAPIGFLLNQTSAGGIDPFHAYANFNIKRWFTQFTQPSGVSQPQFGGNLFPLITQPSPVPSPPYEKFGFPRKPVYVGERCDPLAVQLVDYDSLSTVKRIVQQPIGTLDSHGARFVIYVPNPPSGNGSVICVITWGGSMYTYDKNMNLIASASYPASYVGWAGTDGNYLYYFPSNPNTYLYKIDPTTLTTVASVQIPASTPNGITIISGSGPAVCTMAIGYKNIYLNYGNPVVVVVNRQSMTISQYLVMSELLRSQLRSVIVSVQESARESASISPQITYGGKAYDFAKYLFTSSNLFINVLQKAFASGVYPAYTSFGTLTLDPYERYLYFSASAKYPVPIGGVGKLDLNTQEITLSPAQTSGGTAMKINRIGSHIFVGYYGQSTVNYQLLINYFGNIIALHQAGKYDKINTQTLAIEQSVAIPVGGPEVTSDMFYDGDLDVLLTPHVSGPTNFDVIDAKTFTYLGSWFGEWPEGDVLENIVSAYPSPKPGISFDSFGITTDYFQLGQGSGLINSF